MHNDHDIAIDADNVSSSNCDASKTLWIGNMIQAPPGEQGHSTNVHGHLGFHNDDIFGLAGITHQKWGQYMVSDIDTTLLLIHYSLPHTDSGTGCGPVNI